MSEYSNASIRQPITISGLFFYFQGSAYSYLLPKPLTIYDNVRVNIPIPDDALLKSGEDMWRELTGMGIHQQNLVNLKTE